MCVHNINKYINAYESREICIYMYISKVRTPTGANQITDTHYIHDIKSHAHMYVYIYICTIVPPAQAWYKCAFIQCLS